MDAALGLLRNELMKKKILVHKAYAANLPRVKIDENQIKQIYINIILNAIYAMPKLGELSLFCSPKELTRKGARIGQRKTDCFKVGDVALVCEVKDTGCGISKENLKKIFDPFFTTKPPGAGTGLGMSITHTIIEQHKGFIEVESKEGKGTTVRIVFPLDQGGENGKKKNSHH